MRILAIDPGATTGVAYFDQGKLFELGTETAYGILEAIKRDSYDIVVFEKAQGARA